MNHLVKWFYRAWRYRLRLERAEIAWLLSNLSTGQTAVDIGAHKGAYTWWMAKCVTEKGRVFAFEPQPELAADLATMVRSRQLKQVRVESRGMSLEASEMQLRVPGPGNSPGASFEDTRDTHGGHRVNVKVTSLDKYFLQADKGPVHLIKCDAEGHELQIFKGGERLLRRYRPHLLFECEARHRGTGHTSEVFSYLADLGYTGFFFVASGLTPIGEFDESKHQAQPGRPGYVNNFLFTDQGKTINAG